MKSFKVAVVGVGETTFSYNGLRFATREQAQAWGEDLYSRWTGMESFEVQESEDEPNRGQ